MTAPALSPAEHAETVRFGVQDEEAFREIVENVDVVLPCLADDCDASATHVVALTCCGHHWFACDVHVVQGEFQCRLFLAGALLRGTAPTCRMCRHAFPFGSSFDDVYTVDKL